MFQTHIFCLVRELPDQKGIDRVRSCLVEYGILPKDPKTASDQLQLLDTRFRNRVTAIKGWPFSFYTPNTQVPIIDVSIMC